MDMNHDTLAALAKQRGVTKRSLLALTPVSDPFNIGTEGDWKAARWFKEMWDRFGFATGAHIRRMHYRLVSQAEPVLLWPGILYNRPQGDRPYVNSIACEAALDVASSAARYLGLVPFDAVADNKNPHAHEYVAEPVGSPSAFGFVDERWMNCRHILGESDLFQLDSMPAVPQLLPSNYQPVQRYFMEVWAEKSTMNDVLDPLCRRYGVNLMTGTGQLSITQLYHAAKRIAASGKPARILYLSDLDPQGENMPVAAARKLEWFQHFATSPLRDALSDADIRLEKIALTLAQAQHYAKPRTPLKDFYQGNEDWANRNGEGGTEIDTLEAIYPGVLASIVGKAILHYYDEGLSQRVWQVHEQVCTYLDERRDEALGDLRERMEAAQAQYDALEEEIGPQLHALSEEVGKVWTQAERAVDVMAYRVDLSAYPRPEAAKVIEDEHVLYDSARDYDEQLDAYKIFQGRAAEEVAS